MLHADLASEAERSRPQKFMFTVNYGYLLHTRLSPRSKSVLISQISVTTVNFS